jgi:DHA2 family multidrug resistance protein
MEALWTANASVAHADLASKVTPGNPLLAGVLPPGSGAFAGGLGALNGEITRQAAMVSYLDDFKLMLFVTLAVMPMLLLMRRPGAREEGVHVVAD